MCSFKYFVLLFYICSSYASVIVKKCPDFIPVDNFNFKAMNGTWHEVARYPNEYEFTNCGTYNFKFIDEDKMMMQIVASNITVDSTDYVQTIFEVAPDAGDKGILIHEVSYGNPRTTFTLRQDIVAVDYDRYYIGIECNLDKETNTVYEYFWIMARSKDYDDETKAAVDNYLNTTNDIDKSKLIWLDMEHTC